MYPDPELMTGGFLGDFVKGRLNHQFPTKIVSGIQTHRAIDVFSDAHPVFATSAARLRSSLGRYSPIAVDVIYDYCLARHWDVLLDIDIGQFCDETYAAWDTHSASMPEPARAMAKSMERHRSFERYHEPMFIERALRAVSQRARKQNPLADAMPGIEPHLPELEEDFLAFYPHLAEHANQKVAELTNHLI